MNNESREKMRVEIKELQQKIDILKDNIKSSKRNEAIQNYCMALKEVARIFKDETPESICQEIDNYLNNAVMGDRECGKPYDNSQPTGIRDNAFKILDILNCDYQHWF